MRSVVLNGLSLLGDGVTDYILQTPIQGLDAPDYRMTSYSKPGEDGSVVSSLFYDKRVITLTGIIKGDTAASFEANRQALAKACAISKDTNGFPQALVLSFTTLGGNSYFVQVYPGKPVFDYDQPNFSKFMLNLTSASPSIFGSTQALSPQIKRASGGGFKLPVKLPIVSSGGLGGSAILVNNGGGISYPVITLTGQLTNPYIYNSAAGKSFQLNYTIPAGATVVIDMLNKLITLNGNSPLLSTKDSLSDWWGLQPGSNPISFSSGSTSDTGNVQFSYYHSYLAA